MKPLFLALALAMVNFGTAQAAALTEKSDAAIRAAVKQLSPAAQVSSIKASPMPGVFEVIVGTQVLYFSSDGEHVMQGSMVEVDTRRNLTENALSSARQGELAKVPSQDMIVFPATGKKIHTVKVFTDIDCGYCRKLHEEVAEINALGIEVQYLWFPRGGVPSESSRKAVAVWCAVDQHQAMTDAKRGIDPGQKTCPNPIQKNFDLGQQIGVNGTPAIIAEDGYILPGYLPAAQLLAELRKHTTLAKTN